MGDSDEIDFYSENDIFVLWNMEDYPIPADVDPRSIHSKILEALEVMGFHSWQRTVAAYGERLEYRRLWDGGIVYSPETDYSPERGYDKAAFKIPLDLIMKALMYRQTSLVVIAKQSPKSELHRVQQCLNSRHQTVLLVEGPDQESLFQSVDSIVSYSQLLCGRKPRSSHKIYSDFEENDVSSVEEDPSVGVEDPSVGEEDLSVVEEDLSVSEEEEDSSNILDFSEPTTPPVNEGYTGVFWDIQDSPFPLCSNPDEIYSRIYSDLRQRGCRGKVVIWAYVDEKKGFWGGEFLRKKTWEASIYFLPGGDDKALRLNRMFNDILLFAMDTPAEYSKGCFLPSLMVVSDQFRDDTLFYRYLKKFAYGAYHVVTVIPTPDINKPESPDWPELLMDEGLYAFCYQRKNKKPAKETPKGSGDEG